MPSANSEATDERGIGRIDHRFGSDQACDHAAAIDVADQHHGRIGGACKPHIGYVVGAQIDLRGAAGAFDEHDVGLRLEARKAVEHGRHQLRLDRLVFRGLGCAVDAALHHDLRADLALRLEQDRVHVHARGNPRGARLQRLGAADLAAIAGDRGVVRHVLRLERAHREPAIGKGARETRDDQRLADVRAGALEHERARVHFVRPPSRCTRIFCVAPCASTRCTAEILTTISGAYVPILDCHCCAALPFIATVLWAVV
jgi:hypothetical protein